MNDAFGRLVYGMGMAIVLVYLLQVALFRSWVGPFIIMFTVPLGIIGVSHHAVRDADDAERAVADGDDLPGRHRGEHRRADGGVRQQAAAHRHVALSKRSQSAAAIRFRPIMMTFLAAFFDLLPMAIGFERGSEATVPLARAVVGGLVVSTLLGRFVLPVLYTLLIKEEDIAAAEARIEAEMTAEPLKIQHTIIHANYIAPVPAVIDKISLGQDGEPPSPKHN